MEQLFNVAAECERSHWITLTIFILCVQQELQHCSLPSLFLLTTKTIPWIQNQHLCFPFFWSLSWMFITAFCDLCVLRQNRLKGNGLKGVHGRSWLICSFHCSNYLDHRGHHCNTTNRHFYEFVAKNCFFATTTTNSSRWRRHWR